MPLRQGHRAVQIVEMELHGHTKTHIVEAGQTMNKIVKFLY